MIRPRTTKINLALGAVGGALLAWEAWHAYQSGDWHRVSQLVIAGLSLAGAGTVDNRPLAQRLDEALAVIEGSALGAPPSPKPPGE